MSTPTFNSAGSDSPPATLLRMRQHDFLMLMRQLERHGEHRREAGAFLLAPAHTVETSQTRRLPISLRRRVGERLHLQRRSQHGDTVTAVAYYRDLDPDSLTGGITFHAVGYTRLSELCRSRNLKVVADIHLHPGEGTRQSSTDADHPMVACPGHLALIAPRLGARVIAPAELGAHVMEAAGWTSYFTSEVANVFQVRPTLRGMARLLALYTRTWASRESGR